MIRTSLTVHAFTEGSGSILAGKESTCDAGDTGSWVRKIHWRRHRLLTPVFLGFPGGSEGKESACNAGDPGSIPGLGRCPGEGIGYPLQYSWASLVAQLVRIHLQCGDLDLIPGLERFPWRREQLPLQYSGLENSMDCMVRDVTKILDNLLK